MTDEKKKKTPEEKIEEQPLSEIQQSILARFLGRRALEHVRRKWHRYHSPKAQKKRKVKRTMAKKSRKQNRKKKK